jgi:hypothetical protein
VRFSDLCTRFAIRTTPEVALPQELKDAPPLGIWRMIDGRMVREYSSGSLQGAIVQPKNFLDSRCASCLPPSHSSAHPVDSGQF